MPIFVNRASLSYNNTVTNSNTVTGNLIETLSVTKTAVVDTYARGDSITYVVNVVNSGNTPYNGLTVTDNLGAYTDLEETFIPLTYIEGSLLYYLNGTVQPTPAVTAGDTLAISDINIPAGGSALFIYQAEANGFAPLNIDGNITNTVTVSGGGLAEAVTASATVTPESEANLSISKAICPAVVTENGQLTYTFVIQNTGNTATLATDDLIVTDVFDPILENIVVTYNDTVLTEGTDYTYVDGTFTTANGVVSVPAATYTRAEDGTWVINPGVSVITVTGTV